MARDRFILDYWTIIIPEDTPVWHWGTPKEIRRIRKIIANGTDFHRFDEDPTGKGLYVSTSAVAQMDRRAVPLYAEVKAGTRALLVDPRLFPRAGLPELMDRLLEREYRLRLPALEIPRKYLGAYHGREARILHRLCAFADLPCCLFQWGFHLAFMVRKSSCLRFRRGLEPEPTVLLYLRGHPNATCESDSALLDRWLEARGIDPDFLLGIPKRSGHETLLHLPVRVLLELIAHTPAVCGGRACIRNSRMPVWTLEQMRRQGASNETILDAYPTISGLELFAALVYALKYREEIERDIRENEKEPP